jgi:nucleolar protein 14
MTAEERMLERFTKEKQRNSRSATFNLDDEDELTHYGQSLNAMDDFDSTGLGLEDDEEERRGVFSRYPHSSSRPFF